jgi:hypothetical protein
MRLIWQGPTTLDNPANSDVRLGTANGGGTGTLAVPDPKYVQRGVATDNTVGTEPKVEGW